MANVKVKAKAVPENLPENEPVELHAEDWKLDYEDLPEPRQKVTYDADALNEEFDATYEGKQKDKPFFKKVSFWIIALLAVAAFAALYLYNEHQNQLENVPATTATSVVEVSTTVKEEMMIEVKDFVMPAGSSVVKGPKGWGLYDYYGNLNSTYVGIAANDNGTWFINHGLCDFGFTGLLKVGETTYHVEKGKVDVAAPVRDSSADEGTTVTSAANAPTTVGTNRQQEAAKEAKDYLMSVSSSRNWLIAQLQSDGFSYDDSVWGADHCGADWNEQAYKKAQEYLSLTTFTKDDLVTQLVFEGFTQEQANYAVSKVGL